MTTPKQFPTWAPRVTPTFYECSICGAMHSAEWSGDCREDARRYDIEDIEAAYGPNGFEEIDMNDVDAWAEANPEQFARWGTLDNLTMENGR